MIAKWIAAPASQDKTPEPLFRREFSISRAVASARLYASGLGYMELTLDGKRIGNSVLDPAFTRYDKRVQYVTYDLDSLSVGDHVIGARLGRGFFGLQQHNLWWWETAVEWHADPRLILQLEINYADGSTDTIGTDDITDDINGTDETLWKTCEGPTRSDSIYGGETYDARFEQLGWDMPGFNPPNNAPTWRPVVEVNGPLGVPVPQSHPPIRVVETIRPVDAWQVTEGKYQGDWVFDMGRNIAGWVRIRVSGATETAGTTVTLRYDEKLAGPKLGVRTAGLIPDPVDGDNPGGFWVSGRFQTDQYVIAGRGSEETWEPRYSYKGFQYVQVNGWPGTPILDDLDGRVVHSDVKTIGSFTCSNDLFNTVHDMVRQTVVNNLHGIPTDCPTYEKNGWMGDALIMAEANLFNLDLAALYVKWLDDIRDSRSSDALPAIAPDHGWSFGGYAESPPWTAAYIIIPWCIYLYYGDSQPLSDHYNEMKAYVDNQLNAGINSSMLGDYMSPANYGNPPEDLNIYGTAYAYLMAKTLADAAVVLGKDPTALQNKASGILSAFKNYFNSGQPLDPKVKDYRQAPNVMALALGLVPDELESTVFDNLVKDVERNGLNTGHIGTKYLLTELTKRGEGELASAVATQRDYPSWGSWVDRGATTCWEYWDEPDQNGKHARSLDHAFLGTIDEWFFNCLVGVEPTSPGYTSVQIKPWLLGGLREVSGEVPTPNGPLAVYWQRLDDCSASFDLTIPANTVATFYLPASDLNGVTVNGQPADAVSGVVLSGVADGRQVLLLDPGSYLFQVPLGAAPCIATRLHLCAAQNNGAILTHAEHDDVKGASGGWFPVENMNKKLPDTKTVRAVATAANGAELHVCISDAASRSVWHSLRAPDKSWQPFWGDVQAEERGRNINGRASAVACAATPAGDLHLCAIADNGSQPFSGELWHTIRFADGRWQTEWGHVMPDGKSSPIEPVCAVACAATADDGLHVCAIGRDAGLYHTIRFADGTWQPFWGAVRSGQSKSSDGGSIVSVSCATQDGDLHICVVTSVGRVWHTIRFADAKWQPSWGDVVTAASGGGFGLPAFQVACAAGVRDRTLYVTVTDHAGKIWYTRRDAGGGWTELSATQLMLDPVTRLALCDALVG
jgi:alpha-L-rhamnosidase